MAFSDSQARRIKGKIKRYIRHPRVYYGWERELVSSEYPYNHSPATSQQKQSLAYTFVYSLLLTKKQAILSQHGIYTYIFDPKIFYPNLRTNMSFLLTTLLIPDLQIPFNPTLVEWPVPIETSIQNTPLTLHWNQSKTRFWNSKARC